MECPKPLFLGPKQGFPNIPYIQNIQNTFYSEYIEYIASKLNLYFCKKLVPTQILVKNLITITERRALQKRIINLFSYQV